MLLCWAIRGPRGQIPAKNTDPASLEETGRSHATYLPVVCRALSVADLEFLAARASSRLVRRAHRERQRIAVLYVTDLHSDFEKLLRLARVIGILSPQVEVAHEFARWRLTFQFSWRYRMVLLGLNSGLLWLPQISGLSQIVSDLAASMESAIKELGERAAMAAELASSLDRRGLDLA